MSVRQFEEERQQREQKLIEENKRLREALESITEIELDRLATDVWSEASQMKRIAIKALEGDKQ